jgi:hypothetical protein
LILLAAAEATPLHNLSRLFQSQTPEAYQKLVAKSLGEQEGQAGTQLRSGTAKDLKERMAASGAERTPATSGASSKPPVKSPAARSPGTGKINSQARGQEARPAQIGRNLEGVTTQTAEAARKGRIDANSQAMQARELIEVLAYFNAENVNWDGHMGPNCDYAGFLRTAREMLPRFGDLGAEAVVQGLAEELTGVTIPTEVTNNVQSYVSVYNSVYRGQQQNPLTRDRQLIESAQLTPERAVQKTLLMNPTYHADLLDLLRFFKSQGQITPAMKKHLQTCAAGKKDPEVARLALEVKRLLSDNDLVSLLETLDQAVEPQLRRDAREKLEKLSPTYAEVKEHIGQIREYLDSSNREAAAAARAQLENAFLRAPVTECLVWLGGGDAGLNKLIWEQLDDRISRADKGRRDDYRQRAAAVLIDKQRPVPVRQAALQFFGRLGDVESAEILIDNLTTLPRDLWPPAGDVLRQISGQSYGPRAGDGAAELGIEIKKWREWLKQEKSK